MESAPPQALSIDSSSWREAAQQVREGAMQNPCANHWRAALAAAFLLVAAAGITPAAATSDADPQTIELAQGGGTEPRDLEPRYHPAPPPEESWYNSSYIFAVTR